MSSKSILLVDDEENILVSTRWVLEKNDFKVTTAAGGREALDELRASRYDLVVTDLRMPDVDGIAVLKEAKRLYPETGVIVLTGYGEVSTAVETLKLGADDYLQKPCDIDELLDKARRNFERQDMLLRLHEQNVQLRHEIAARKSIERRLSESHATLEEKVEQRTAELSTVVKELEAALERLVARERELEANNLEVSEINSALSAMLKRRDREHKDLRKEIAQKTVEMVLPLIKKAESRASGSVKNYLETARENLLDTFSEHPQDSVFVTAKLAPRELQVVHYIRQDKSSKEIAELLQLTVSTVDSYRENIRKKLRIKNKKINLKKFITSIR